MSTVCAINKTTSRSPGMLQIIKELFWCSVHYNFKLTALHLPGDLNIVSDRISRLHDLSAACEAHNLLSNEMLVFCNNHMTEDAFLSLQETWLTQGYER
jgi:hypothetical protein